MDLHAKQFPHHGKIRTANSLEELKRDVGPLPHGYRFHVQQFPAEKRADVYMSPSMSVAALRASEMLPEGSRLLGTVKYLTREMMLADLS